jgi:hypothetical protein
MNGRGKERGGKGRVEQEEDLYELGSQVDGSIDRGGRRNTWMGLVDLGEWV